MKFKSVAGLIALLFAVAAVSAAPPARSASIGSWYQTCLRWAWQNVGQSLAPGAATWDHAVALFREFKTNPIYASEFVEDGCDLRTHLFCRNFDVPGVEVEKIFAISGTESDLVFKSRSRLLPDEEVEWIYHVAPTLRVWRGGRVVRMVLDPALADEPIPVAAWLRVLSPHRSLPFQETGHLDITSDFYTIVPKFVLHAAEDGAPRDRWRREDTELVEEGMAHLRAIERQVRAMKDRRKGRRSGRIEWREY